MEIFDEHLDMTVEAVEIECYHCGATTSMPPQTSDDRCPFCATPLPIDEAVMKRLWKPDYILPFKITEKECVDIVRKRIFKWWLASSKLKNIALAPNNFKGVYLPFWSYDSNTYTEYQGECAVESRTTHKNDDDKTKEDTITDYYRVSGNVNVSFNDVSVSASLSLPETVINEIGDWDTKNCVEYRNEFLEGFFTEICQQDFRDLLDEAKKEMGYDIDNAIKKDIGGDMQRINTKKTEFADIKFKHLLLPVWVCAFHFNNKIYQFVVNARSGKIHGKIPGKKLRIAVLVLIIIIFATIIKSITNI